MQLIATALFFIVFVQLFVVLSIYLWKTLYDYIKGERTKKPVKPTMEQESVKLHISEGLIEVNRLPDTQEKVERE